MPELRKFGRYDTHEGTFLQIAGEEHPRVHVRPDGKTLTGDGTAAPVLAAAIASPAAPSTLYDSAVAASTKAAVDKILAVLKAAGLTE